MGERIAGSAADALASVYIAQFVRPDGLSRAGVLLDDCRRYSSELDQLESRELVRRQSWVRLNGFVTTPSGDSEARRIVQQRLITHEPGIRTSLDGLPSKLAAFLLNLLLDPWGHGMNVRVERQIGCIHTAPGERSEYACLLRDDAVLDARDILLHSFREMGLVAEAHSYVSTRGGEIQEEKHVPAPELVEFAERRLVEQKKVGRLWSDQQEAAHSTFHLLEPVRFDSRPFEELRRDVPVRLREDVDGFVGNCVRVGALEEIPIQGLAMRKAFRITDRLAYEDALSEQYWKPLAESLTAGVSRTANEGSQGPSSPPSGRPTMTGNVPEQQKTAEPRPAPASSAPTLGSPTPTARSKDLVLGDRVVEDDLRRVTRDRSLTEDERREALPAHGEVAYPLAAATTHTAIFGINGSGKSLTTKRLVRELIRLKIPVTVIDWHDEYVELIRELGGIVAVPPTATTKPAAEEIPFTWNVLDRRFYTAEVTPEATEDYIQIVVDLLSPRDLMALSEPMKGGLAEAIRLAYHQKASPTFRDVIELVNDVAVPLQTADALRRRLQSFSAGSLGSIFCSETSFDPPDTFRSSMAVRVKHLTADHQSAVGLLTFFLLRQASSHFKAMGEVRAEAPVRHAVVIDEAPMVIGSNPKVEREVVRMLQEIRKFGEGIILVCRNPGISDDILRETNQKIAHKLDVPKDVTAVADMLGLTAGDRPLLRSLPRGVAFARVAGNPTTLVRVRGEKGTNSRQ